MPVSEITKIKIARVLSSSPFWMAIIVAYFVMRGVALPDVYKLISYYYICIVLFEYPTGVLGDYYSHKTSVAVGYFITALVMFSTALPLNTSYFYVTLTLLAFGQACISGSDTALFHSISTDFKKDASQLKSIVLTWSLLAITLGGFIGKYSFTVPIFLTALANLGAFIVILFVKTNGPVLKREGNVFNKAVEGIRHIKSNKNLIYVIALNTLVSAVFLSMKWIYNPFFEGLKVDITWWGLLISGAALLKIGGVLLYKKLKTENLVVPFILMIGAFIVMSFTNTLVLLPLSALLFAHMIGEGFIETSFEIDINRHIKDSVRASVLSFTSLLIRLSSSLYVFFGGFLLTNFPLPYLFVFTSVLFGVVGLPLLFLYGRNKNAVEVA